MSRIAFVLVLFSSWLAQCGRTGCTRPFLAARAVQRPSGGEPLSKLPSQLLARRYSNRASQELDRARRTPRRGQQRSFDRRDLYLCAQPIS